MQRQTALAARRTRLDAMIQPYDISINQILGESWKQLKGLKKIYWAGVFALVCSSLMLFVIKWGLARYCTYTTYAVVYTTINILANIILFYPLITGLWLIALRHIQKQPLQYKMLFESITWKNILHLTLQKVFLSCLYIFFIIATAAMAIFTGALKNEGNLIFNASFIATLIVVMVLVIYFSISYFFAGPLIVAKQLTAWDGLSLSRIAVNKHWFKIALLLLINVIIISLISALTLGIGAIWALPWGLIVNSNIYFAMFDKQTTPQID